MYPGARFIDQAKNQIEQVKSLVSKNFFDSEGFDKLQSQLFESMQQAQAKNLLVNAQNFESPGVSDSA